ncbi:MAG TPA: c-type cytochrome, partial [Ramlibacter sp.]
MNSILKPIMACATFLVAFTASAQPLAGAQLAEDKQCMQCHSVEKDTIGPSFEKIKAIYRTMKDPRGSLIEMMRLGSDAHLGPMWGKARMPDSSER